MHNRETSQKKAFCNTNIKILQVLHDEIALLMRRSGWGTRNCHQKRFRKVWGIYIENVDQMINFFMTLMKLRLDFLFTDLSQPLGIYLVVFALTFLIHW